MSAKRCKSGGSEEKELVALERATSNTSNNSEYVYEDDDDEDEYHDYEDYDDDYNNDNGNDDGDGYDNSDGREIDRGAMYVSSDENCGKDLRSSPKGSSVECTSSGKYSYSDRMKMGESGVRIAEYPEIQNIMMSLIQEISSLFNIPEDSSRILLCYMKWNRERLVDRYYSDSDELLAQAGVVSKDENAVGLEEGIVACPICADEAPAAEMLSLTCNHLVCRVCWGAYLNSKVEEGPSCIKTFCPMFKCGNIVPASVFDVVGSANAQEKYYLYMTRNFIETSKNFKYCPSAGCDKVAIASTGVTTVRCECGEPFCFKCGEESHDPVQCSYLVEWAQKCSNESETANWILANTKKCTQCNARIEKNQGCNHMVCKICKFEFCWICMGSWSEHGQTTGGYYKCNRFEGGVVDEAATDAQKAKMELDRYLHYYQRYIAHDKSLKYATGIREEAEKRMVELQETGKSAWIDVQFLKQAVEQVIECRRVLKYTYVLGYFLEDLTQEKRLFEHHQEMLEKHTETLHHYTEMSLENLDRTQVVNLTRVAEKFMSSLLASLD